MATTKAQERPVEGWHTLRLEILERDGFECQSDNCTKSAKSGHTLHVHHITPVVRGGSYEGENLVTLCKSCHRDAHKKHGTKYHPDEFIEALEHLGGAGTNADISGVVGCSPGTVDRYLKRSVVSDQVEIQGKTFASWWRLRDPSVSKKDIETLTEADKEIVAVMDGEGSFRKDIRATAMVDSKSFPIRFGVLLDCDVIEEIESNHEHQSKYSLVYNPSKGTRYEMSTGTKPILSPLDTSCPHSEQGDDHDVDKDISVDVVDSKIVFVGRVLCSCGWSGETRLSGGELKQ